MFRRLITKISLALKRKKSKDASNQLLTQQFKHKCLQFITEHQQAADSTYFNLHLPMILEPKMIQPVLEEKIDRIEKRIKKANGVLELLLGNILLEIIQEDGLFYMLVKLWISGFCAFQIKKIVQHYKKQNQKYQRQKNIINQLNQNNNEQNSHNSTKDVQQNLFYQSKTQQQEINNSMMASKKPLTILSNPILEQKKIQAIKQFFHKQFFLFVYFIYQLALFFYQDELQKSSRFQSQELFTLIRNTITSVRYMSEVHQLFRIHVNCRKVDFSQEEIQANMRQLEKLCKISTIPAGFLESQNQLNIFVKSPQIDQKLKTASKIIQTLKSQIISYREFNQMKKQYAICADDILTALTYVMWRLRKNLYGPCLYAEIILCCEYEKVEEEKLAHQLNRFGENTRHSFDTLRSVGKIGLLDAEKIYGLA